MLHKPGWNSFETGDMDLIADGDDLHMFFLELPSHDRVGHAVSRDGMRWKLLPHAIHTGEPGDFDDDQIWTMHTFEFNGKYHMLYTALAAAEQGCLQRTGLALSDDLIHWEKVTHNPVAAPDARWYEADLADSGRADWRDPFPWVEDDVIHALICAHENHGPTNRRGCVAHITSTDGLHWEVKEPFYCTGNNTDFEVPTIVKLDGRYFLIGHHCSPAQDVYRVADSIEGPWHRPADDWVLPAPNHAFAPTVFKGQAIITNWIRCPLDWNTGTSAGNAAIIVPPKEVHATPTGEMILRSYAAGWNAVAAGDAQPVDFASIYRGTWSSGCGDCSPGMGLQHLAGTHRDFIFEGDITWQGAVEAGIVWRSDEQADQCTRVVLTPGRGAAALQRLTRRRNYNALGRGCDVLQTNHHTCTARTRLRVVAWGPYIEVSLDGRVVLSYLTMSRREGSVGLFVEDGIAGFSDMTLRVLDAPDGFAD